MNAKPTEHFHESVISVYKEMIHEALLECEHEARTVLDHDVLTKKINEISLCAKVDGLSEFEIKSIVKEAMEEWQSHHKVAV